MHLPTVIAVTLVTNLLIGFFLFVLYRRRTRDRCFQLWGLSCVTFVAGSVLASGRAYGWPAVLSYFVADLLLVLAPVLVAAGLVQFSRISLSAHNRTRLWLVLAVATTGLFLSHPHAAVLNLFSATLIAIVFAGCARLMQASIPYEPLYNGVLQGIFYLHALVMLLQGAIQVLYWPQDVYLSMPLMVSVTLFSHLLLSTLAALFLPWLSFLKLERKLTLRSQRDGLTQLANRNHFFEQAKRLWQKNPNLPVAVMMIDIDHFKSINDQHGHALGDKAIQTVARVISSGMRKEDIIGRIGGEEFAALLVNLDQAVAQQIANRLCQQVAREVVTVDDKQVNMTISIGLICVVPGQHPLESVFKAADDALYTTKRDGRDGVTVGNIAVVV